MSQIDNNIISPTVDSKHIQNGFHEQKIKSGSTRYTPLTQAYFSHENIQFLKKSIEHNLKKYTGDPNLQLILNEEFLQVMVEIATNNTSYSYNVKEGLPRLNQWTINHETEILVLSMRKQKQYENWILKGNRMQIFPYGMGDRTLHVKGENQQTHSPYLLNHPWQSQHNAFLDQVLHVRNPECGVAPRYQYNSNNHGQYYSNFYIHQKKPNP